MKFERLTFQRDQEEKIEDLTTEYPYVMRLADIGRVEIPWHWHEEVEFDYVVSGELEVQTVDRTLLFHKNEAFFINRNVLACMRKTPAAATALVHSHLFHPVFLSGHYRSIFETKYVDPVIRDKSLDILEIRGGSPRQEKMQRLLRQAAFLQKQENTELQTRNLFSELWLLLMEEMRERPARAGEDSRGRQERMQNMLAFIHQNYRERITLEQIAEAAGVSARECGRCFQASIRRSPIEYLMDYRLAEAKKLLKKTELPVTEIALAAGFSSEAYFCRRFREKYGITPGKYRRGGRDPRT